MNSRIGRRPVWTGIPSLLLLLLSASFPASRADEAGLTLWDTMSPLSRDKSHGAKEGWRVVPNDLFKLEANPLKSMSDPGYYGREYAFKGDMVVENQALLALFSSAQGKVFLSAKTREGKPADKAVEIAPLGNAKGTIRKFNVLRNVGDEVVAEVSFGEGNEAPVLFSFGKNEIVEVRPGERQPGISIRGETEYGVVPSFVGDDLLVPISDEPVADRLTLPANNLLLALLRGENEQLVVTWPAGHQRVSMSFGKSSDAPHRWASIDIETDGKSVFLAAQSAPGIWHREALNSSYLEKEVASRWKRPFPARWVTQLNEAGVPARFAFREDASTVWRGVPGSYNYPVWFDDGNAFFHLSKKVAPKGEAIIYFLEGQGTPASVLTPVEILKQTIGRAEAEPILDVAGRKLRTHHRRGGEGVRRACTCGCTEAIQAIFESGEESARREQIQQEIGDMIFFVQSHVQRIEEYQRFAGDMIAYLKSKGQSAPDLKPYLEQMQSIAEQIPQEYEVQKENMKSLDYAHELSERTMRLTEKNEKGNLAAYMELLKAWRGMGGAQDYVVAQCHTLTRRLFQQASYESLTQPRALETAQEIRSRCRGILRNADGYEIWPNY